MADRMTGFPPAAENRVDLAGWQDGPNVRWAFRHMRELIPTHAIPADSNHVRPLRTAIDPTVGATPVTRLDGAITRADGVFADTWTDALLVLHDGVVVEEQYLAGMTDRTPHLLMSVSKSIVGCVAGILADRGLLDPEAPVTTYVPEVAGSGYGDATVRHLLDMRTGVAFSEIYQEADSEVRVMERSMGWRPRADGDPIGMYDYLTTLGTATAHGRAFTYRSADTDMLGWVCERAAGTRMADLISTLLWIPLGAEQDADITCDPVGSAIHDGGVSAIARDLARFGQLLLDDGAIDGRQVVPARWLAESSRPGADVRAAFAGTDNEAVLPGGWYRNQFWFVPNQRGTALVCLGIHGQMLYVNHVTGTVGVKLSSWPDPQNTSYLIDTLRAFAAIGARLSSPDA
ncbi:serine hydrolase domain-containing protein [Kribbella sp. NPDC049174]|uniref:serine hydrolase domain-containing protein n=1 Tax=Kribbella sp. NPDC049174 TaxID=3364112 RepID=UPI0037214958